MFRLKVIRPIIIDNRGNNATFLNIYNNALCGNYSAVIDTLNNGGVKYINYCNGQGGGWTALHASASNDHIQVMQLLISNGIKLDSRDDFGNTAMHIAAHNGCKRAVDLLLKSGASATITNDCNDTAYECIEDGRIKNMMTELFQSISNHKVSMRN